ALTTVTLRVEQLEIVQMLGRLFEPSVVGNPQPSFLARFSRLEMATEISNNFVTLIIKPTAAEMRRRATFSCTQGISTRKNPHDFSTIYSFVDKACESWIVEIITTSI